jgi:hypothetical protein
VRALYVGFDTNGTEIVLDKAQVDAGRLDLARGQMRGDGYTSRAKGKGTLIFKRREGERHYGRASAKGRERRGVVKDIES